MKRREIDAILSLLRKVLRSPKLQDEHINAIEKSIKELKTIRQSGKLDTDKAFRVVTRIATVLQQLADEGVLTPEHDDV